MHEAAEGTKQFRTSGAIAFAPEFPYLPRPFKKFGGNSDGRNVSYVERLPTEVKAAP
ncbi:hypothetical protein [Paenibacillus uliginis]|uniref:hypothetical protein n=1 Tax=Paenibacillus uliginis TaxID=683737 RepID=UPI001AD80679|nr:hypothetical protein [Paenibacillus uliginis]